jgi:hypothetical protein
MIDKITFTGVDDGVNPEDLVKISEEHKNVEWGVLLSENNKGKPRYPSSSWLIKLANYNLPLSLHFCGEYVRQVMKKNYVYLHSIVKALKPQRIQLNMMGLENLLLPKKAGVSFILPTKIGFFKTDHHLLYDCSGGRGRLSSSWPKALTGVYCGYAGGLSPDNIKEESKKIREASEGTLSWVDMESHIRTNEKFDLDKVKRVLDEIR